MEKPVYLGLIIVEFSKLLMYVTYYDKLQRYQGPDILQLQYMDTETFVLSTKTNDIENVSKNLQNEYKKFDFSNLNKQQNFF